ncbi:UDP-glucose 4-epimerase [Aliidiomarina minuta]|uniref:UDP-glucose 4-epimerase n=1 Tax=Aliidiomarina minuta TaxID=880057 RepID=A0A432W8G5_9GAMM|nr:SDR family oxidoreductase [Aliidiomarina minuta]RUO26256.1 UDP-glucose 4-epimerase [Aliidiomarina minuta]
MTKVLVTGATGFIGAPLSQALSERNFIVMRTARHARDEVKSMPLDTENWKPALEGVDVVVHCAALAHVPAQSDDAFREKVRTLNVTAAQRLARQAKELGVKRFIFLSSVKAIGESTAANQVYTCESQCLPEDLYGESKREAEVALQQELSGSETDLVIIRPPLVYGPGVKGNFKSLMNIAKRNLPLPFKSVDNKRSLVALDNLVDLIVTCVKYPESLNDTFLVSDDHDVSTRELLDSLTKAYGNEPRLWPYPVSFMRVAARLLGKKAVADRLFGNLQLDISYTRRTLNWEPVVSFEQGIQDCVTTEFNNSNQDKG